MRGVVGPVGSGKSVSCVVELVMRAIKQAPNTEGTRRSRWGVIRNTYPELRSTTIKTWEEWVPDSVCPIRYGSPIDGRLRFPLPDGTEVDSEILFLALDVPSDVRKLLSLELTGIWINEAREISKGVVDQAQARVDRFPKIRDGGGPSWVGVFMDTNPPDLDHWWYRLFVEERPEGWACYHQPSALSKRAENLKNLSKDYYKRLVIGKDEEWVRVYVHGEYGYVADGKPIYPEFKTEMHVAKHDLQPNPKYPIIVGIDFGLTPAAMFAQRDVMGRWQWLSELVTEDMGAVRFGELLKVEMQSKYSGFEFVPPWGDPAGEARAQTDERTPFQILKNLGIDARPAPTNDYTLRREAVAVALSRLVDGEPGLRIDPRMKTTIKGMSGGYCYRRMQVSGGDKFHDKADKNRFSHICFLAGAQVSTPEGRRAIEAIAVGDRVHTPQGARRVVATMARDVEHFLGLRLSNGAIIEVTGNHPFAVPGGAFIRAGELKSGARLVAEGEESLTVLGVVRVKRPAVVHNLTVDVEHVYYVEGALVSNCEAGQYLMIGEGEGAALIRSPTRYKHTGHAPPRRDGRPGSYLGA